MMTLTCPPNTWETEAENQSLQGQPHYIREVMASCFTFPLSLPSFLQTKWLRLAPDSAILRPLASCVLRSPGSLSLLITQIPEVEASRPLHWESGVTQTSLCSHL